MRITVKLGGSILEDDGVAGRILGDIAGLCARGHEVVLVHGGGKSLNRRLAQLSIQSRFEHGLRVTDAETLKVAVMVLAGEVNKRLVQMLASAGRVAVGICGADGAVVRCRPIGTEDGVPGDVDYGFVGVPTEVRRELFDLILGAGMVPVVASIAHGPGPGFYNVNADQMASACAWGTGSSRLIYLTDVDGVLGSDRQVIPDLGVGEVRELVRQGVISGGMLPKTRSCLEALGRGVETVYVVPGARAGILGKLVDGTIGEGTRFHGD